MEFLRLGGSREAKKGRLVGFTFDDGPNPDHVLDILRTLNRATITGTFFWIVENAMNLREANPPLFREILHLIAEGDHEIGLHAPFDYQPTFTSRVYRGFTKEELEESKRVLEGLTGDQVKFYRPHFAFQPATVVYSWQLGLPTIVGNFGSCYARVGAPAERQVQRFSRAKPGTILVFHESNPDAGENHIVEVLPEVIYNLQGRGLKPTKVSNVL